MATLTTWSCRRHVTMLNTQIYRRILSGIGDNTYKTRSAESLKFSIDEVCIERIMRGKETRRNRSVSLLVSFYWQHDGCPTRSRHACSGLEIERAHIPTQTGALWHSRALISKSTLKCGWLQFSLAHLQVAADNIIKYNEIHV